jgi:hypothetical protein
MKEVISSPEIEAALRMNSLATSVVLSSSRAFFGALRISLISSMGCPRFQSAYILTECHFIASPALEA